MFSFCCIKVVLQPSTEEPYGKRYSYGYLAGYCQMHSSLSSARHGQGAQSGGIFRVLSPKEYFQTSPFGFALYLVILPMTFDFGTKDFGRLLAFELWD